MPGGTEAGRCWKEGGEFPELTPVIRRCNKLGELRLNFVDLYNSQ